MALPFLASWLLVLAGTLLKMCALRAAFPSIEEARGSLRSRLSGRSSGEARDTTPHAAPALKRELL